MARKKITIIGAGNVGASVAQQVVAQQLGDVVLVDIVEGLAQGKALDLAQAGTVLGYQGSILGTASYEDTVGSALIVVTSGLPRKPGMNRDDLLRMNFEIVRTVVGHAASASPEATIIVVTNPLDAMTYAALKVSGFAIGRVMGMAGILDTARYRTFLAEALHVSVREVEALVLGGHGDEMVPCLNYTRVAGTPIQEWLAPEQLEPLIARTRNGGAEIVKLLQSGSAYYAPAASVARMIAAVLKDEKAVLPCAVFLNGEYGFKNIVLGVPAVLGRCGVERIVALKLDETDQAALARSAENVTGLCRQVDALLAGK